jgi:hypothetical protein
MTREEPSFETLWLQNIETTDKVQRIDHSNCHLLKKELLSYTYTNKIIFNYLLTFAIM